MSDEEEQERIEQAWAERDIDVPLEIVYARTGSSPTPSCATSTSSTPAGTNDIVTVVIPEFVVDALVGAAAPQPERAALKGRLLFRKGTVVTSVPYHLE